MLSDTHPHQVNVAFSPSAFKKLEDMQKALNVDKPTEVIRQSLRLMEWLLLKKSQNATFLINYGNDDIREVRFGDWLEGKTRH